jgi:anti-sigma regulatory factor (Ser/Thr protein kinase)
MVEILWQRGDVTGALALEGLWNDLARELSFSLYCAYRQDVVAQGVEGALDEACRLHTAVVADGTQRPRQSASAHFDASVDAPAGAREFILEELWDEKETELAGIAALTVSELATNAVRYGGTGFTVTISRLTNTVRISVRDRSAELPAPGPADREGVSGRGLHIVGALSREWGAEPRLDGKVVWAELDCGDHCRAAP